MSLNYLGEEFQHGFEAKAVSINDPSSSLRSTDKEPQQTHSKVDWDLAPVSTRGCQRRKNL